MENEFQVENENQINNEFPKPEQEKNNKAIVIALIVSLMVIAGMVVHFVTNQDFNNDHIQDVDDNDNDSSSDEIIRDLFHRAYSILSTFISEGADEYLIAHLDADTMDYDEYINHPVYEERRYLKTSLIYQDVVDYFSEIFDKEALETLLDIYFIDHEGALYVLGDGGSSGHTIRDVNLEFVELIDDEHFYLATYTVVDHMNETTTMEARFAVTKGNDNYRISTVPSNWFMYWEGYYE